MSQFGFLLPEWPDLHAAAARAEALARGDPRAAAFYARRTLELAMTWLYRADARLGRPWKDNLATLIDEPAFRLHAGEAIYRKAVWIKDTGNRAVHSVKAFAETDARAVLRELFHFAFWLVRTYAKGAKPPDSLGFDPARLPPPATDLVKQSLAQLQKLAKELEEKDAALQAERAARADLDAQVQALRAEVARALAANAARPDTHDYGEAATRDLFIDKLLIEAGWDPKAPGVTEVPLVGMPNPTGEGFADYVLWGADGKPLAVVEAKATRHDPAKGRQQAKLYADCLEQMHGQRPVTFYTNGYEHWIWDDTAHPPREVAGFYRRDELELLVQRRTTRRRLADAPVNGEIVGRYYQTRAIRRIAEAFEEENRRKALVVMATGAGKTRTVIALCDLLMRCNWAKRILFLADRTALVRQAVNAFKTHLPAAAPVNLLTDRDTQGRVYVSTYPTMIKLIEEQGEAGRRFGPGHFDLVIVDEAHRSIYRRYGAIFRWFDSLLVGLTATPKDEIDKNTYTLFDLESGMPTDAYPLEEAVKDKFLVPMRAVSVPLKFPRQGIVYDQLSEEEKEAWDEAEWEDDDPPDRVEAEDVNTFLFNADTVDKVLAHLMTHGQKVEGGDRLGKTIIFAKNHRHAEFIAERFDTNYPHLKGHFARVIDNTVKFADTLIDDFSQPAKAPHIAISVDMLDTGIDVPEVVNLVFFKLVRSKTKFWQMIGRGTRLCRDLFGPGQDKAFFYVFDFCQNLEFFSQDPPIVEGSVGESIAAKLFRARLAVVSSLDSRLAEGSAGDAEAERILRRDVVALLQKEVAAMNTDNFIVRPHRRLVETFAKPEAWEAPSLADRDELAHKVAGLPTELDPEKVEAKQFDLLLLNLQLCLLTGRDHVRLKDSLVEIAAALAASKDVPAIAAEMELILDLQSDAWWQDVTVAELERVRRRLRGLVHLIERRRRKVLYTDFEDQIGEGQEVAFAKFVSADAFARFKEKARDFLRAHEDHIAIHKLRTNLPLTPTDLSELERMLIESGIGTTEEVDKAKAESAGLGLFVRELVGLDRAAAQQAFAGFLAGKTLNAKQIEFVHTIIENLTQSGNVDPSRLYEPPYTRLSASGVEGVFREAEVVELIHLLDDVRQRAVA